MGWYLDQKLDLEKHNEECRRVWEAFHQGNPYRVPTTIRGSIRNLFENPNLNDTGFTFDDFFQNPEAQIRAQLAYQKYVRQNMICDLEMGPPKDGWEIAIDFQNSYDQAWFGAPIRSTGGLVPDTVEIWKEDKNRLYDTPPPDPLRGNLAGRGMEFFEYMWDRCPRMEFEGLPVNPPKRLPWEGTDGILTVAVKLRGFAELLTDMYVDSTYFHDLMAFVTESIIRRIRAVKEWRWKRFPDSPDKGQYRQSKYSFADDACQMLSPAAYREFVLPYHRRLLDQFSDGGHTSVHLCGNTSHLFKILRDELNVYTFDTGFPVDWGRMRQELGPEVQLNAGPSIMVLRAGPAAAVKAEVKRVCTSGIMEGGRFVLREANNLAPCTPIEHIVAMYEAAKEYGRYDGQMARQKGGE